MLDLRGDQMSPASLGCLGNSANRKVVRLRSSREKYDFIRTSIHERGNLTPRTVDGGLRFLSEVVHA
jgi:hypothetical protein